MRDGGPAPRGDASRVAPPPEGGVDGPAPNDFDDQFVYDSAEDDAAIGSVADGSVLTARPLRYEAYGNERFGFTLDVPDALAPMPAPTDGDGMQWRLGKLAALTASGMNWDNGLSATCASSKHVTARKEFRSSCFATGKANGFVFWERKVVVRGVLYSLEFQYAESLKVAMDPVVARVNASWRF